MNVDELSPEQRALWVRVEALWAMLGNGDEGAIRAALHPRYSGWVAGDARPHGREDGVRSAADSAPIRDLHLDPKSVEIYGATGVVEYTYDVTLAGDDGASPRITGRWTEVYTEDAGTWVLVAVCGGPDDPGDNGAQIADTRPAGYHSVTPRMFVDDPAAAVEFLATVFDATGEIQGEQPAEIRIGDSLVLVGSTAYRDAMPACLYVYVDDTDAAYGRAIAAGAETIEAPLDTPYGDRRATVRDRFGNVFQIAHRRPPR